MENALRSERSRNAVIQAALTIIGRDGPGRLTLDAIARESGLSKGGLTHQFRTKGAVLQALLEYQIEYFAKFSRDYLQEIDPAQPEPRLVSQIATLREIAVTRQQHSVAFAILGALTDAPDLLSIIIERDTEAIEQIKAEAADPDLALLRWAAARGLALTTLFRICPLSREDRERLFDLLLDDQYWQHRADPPKPGV